MQTNSGTLQHYNEYCYKSQITDIASGDVLRKINATNARGQVVEEVRGNGATTYHEYDLYFSRTIHQGVGEHDPQVSFFDSVSEESIRQVLRCCASPEDLDNSCLAFRGKFTDFLGGEMLF